MTAPELRRILYVDDEADIREIVAMALELMDGVETVTCGSGREALALVPTFRPDLILLDGMMPEMDGPATLEALRKEPASAAIPVIFVTAKAQPGEVEHFLKLGAIGLIPKPMNTMTLGAQISQMWSRIRG